jgi:2,3-bisphosphoglycerate-dependent phosphoglycerate mutase
MTMAEEASAHYPLSIIPLFIMSSILVLVRHGQSQWNLENRFTGWTDVSLTPQGRADAVLCGKSLKDLRFDAVFLSRLKRAKETYEGLVEGHGQRLPLIEDSALNERHYGDLQGLNKAETVEKFGADQVRLWRRSYSTRPPNGESIEDCERRTWPFFRQYVLPLLKAGKNVLIVAHGNSMRPIIKNLDNLTPDATAAMEIDCSIPYTYVFDGERVIEKEIRKVPGMVVKGTAKI